MTAETHEHDLAGCAPVPLAGYLKALGVLRLVAGQADADARGWWQDETFRLRTRLDRAELTAFFLHAYRPSPVVAPWNGGSGFYDGDNRDGFTPLADSPADRFAGIAAAIRAGREAVARAGLGERPQGEAKAAFVTRLRGELPDEALAWFDAALALGQDGLLFPPLLGTGGNDGRLDFTSNFLRRLASDRPPFGLFDAATGAPRAGAAGLLDAALFGAVTDGLVDAAIGQFSPGAAGGPNATAGFEGPSALNPWDFVLMIEGALLFAGALTRRNDSARLAGASFPFTVRATGAGWGGVDVADEGDARAEFWAPLWSTASGAAEIARLLAEGRAVLNGRTARDGLEFARAAGGLGVARGVTAFQRFGFVMRAGKAYLATPLGRRTVTEDGAGTAALIADLEHRDWLATARRHLRGDTEPARARAAARRLDDALFALADPAAGPGAVQAALAAVGAVARYLATAPKAREALAPPPRLSAAWVEAADDRSPEFRVAAALASLSAPPMAAHLAPLDPTRRGHPAWAGGSRPEAVWGDGDLVRNLLAVLERRRIGREDETADPFHGAAPAGIADVMAFLAGGPDFDDARCAALLAGLAWAEPARLERTPGAGSLPLSYAALKPLFTPAGRLRRLGLLAEDRDLPLPPGLTGRLLRGDVAGAVREALRRARASGIASPFQAGDGRGVDPRRLAASLLIPLDAAGLGRAAARAYPSADPESPHAA